MKIYNIYILNELAFFIQIYHDINKINSRFNQHNFHHFLFNSPQKTRSFVRLDHRSWIYDLPIIGRSSFSERG